MRRTGVGRGDWPRCARCTKLPLPRVLGHPCLPLPLSRSLPPRWGGGDGHGSHDSHDSHNCHNSHNGHNSHNSHNSRRDRQRSQEEYSQHSSSNNHNGHGSYNNRSSRGGSDGCTCAPGRRWPGSGCGGMSRQSSARRLPRSLLLLWRRGGPGTLLTRAGLSGDLTDAQRCAGSALARCDGSCGPSLMDPRESNGACLLAAGWCYNGVGGRGGGTSGHAELARYTSLATISRRPMTLSSRTRSERASKGSTSRRFLSGMYSRA